jgi:hypothetical protein
MSRGATYQVTLQREALLNFLSNLAPTLAKDPQNARFIFNDDTRQLELIQHAVIGAPPQHRGQPARHPG